eukprot:scaffold349_cov352-Prasinococcus_capsulatus_cf.AAC.10
MEGARWTAHHEDREGLGELNGIAEVEGVPAAQARGRRHLQRLEGTHIVAPVPNPALVLAPLRRRLLRRPCVSVDFSMDADYY